MKVFIITINLDKVKLIGNIITLIILMYIIILKNGTTTTLLITETNDIFLKCKYTIGIVNMLAAKVSAINLNLILEFI